MASLWIVWNSLPDAWNSRDSFCCVYFWDPYAYVSFPSNCRQTISINEHSDPPMRSAS